MSETTTAGAATPRPRSSPEDEPRRVALDGVHNMRDLGGLRTIDGRTVKHGVLYRSDQLKDATEADLGRIAALGLRTVVDLRTPAEIEAHGHFSADGVAHHHVELLHLPWYRFPQAGPDAAPAFLPQRYIAMLETGAGAIRDSLNLFTGKAPALVHCIAGKDRTGIVVAVTLALLGVPDADIADDYRLTGHGQRRFQEWAERNRTARVVGFPTPAQAMLDTLTGLRDRFGSVETYARVIGFEDVDGLRDALLD